MTRNVSQPLHSSLRTFLNISRYISACFGSKMSAGLRRIALFPQTPPKTPEIIIKYKEQLVRSIFHISLTRKDIVEIGYQNVLDIGVDCKVVVIGREAVSDCLSTGGWRRDRREIVFAHRTLGILKPYEIILQKCLYKEK